MALLFRRALFPALVVLVGCGSSSPRTPDGAGAAPADARMDIASRADVAAIDARADASATAACGASAGGNGWALWTVVEPRARSYDTSAAEVVLDRTTNLVWQRRVAPDALDWEGAHAYCSCLRVGGHDDWRLPTRIELVSLVDYTRQEPSIDPVVFPDTPVTWFWSSSTVAGNERVAAWYLSFMDGNTHSASKEVAYAVRCVRQGPAGPRAPYQIGTDTVVDPNTKLTWQRAVDDTMRTWDEARSHCQGLSLAGGGWRLPTMAELQTLIDDAASEPAIDRAAFPDTPSDGFWADTPLADMPPYRWFVNFDGAVAYNAMPEHPYHVRCVRR